MTHTGRTLVVGVAGHVDCEGPVPDLAGTVPADACHGLAVACGRGGLAARGAAFSQEVEEMVAYPGGVVHVIHLEVFYPAVGRLRTKNMLRQRQVVPATSTTVARTQPPSQLY